MGEDQALARRQKRPFNPHYYAAGWETVGETHRLLSFEGAIESFQGGAHPNHDFRALLWDRSAGREVAVAALFARSDGLSGASRAAYCKALDAERAERREGETLEGEFGQWPKLSELAIAPVDEDKDGRFDKIDFVAAPYVAGPYVEGEYSLELPVTAALIQALKPEYRASFEAQPQ